MLSKVKLLLTVVAVVSFLLSLWGVPALLVWVALCVIQTLWMQIALCVLALLWLYLLKPWRIFRDDKFPRFVNDLRRAIIAIFFQ